MRIAYLDCFAGISGDMLLGALVDAGIDPEVLHRATAALNLGASLKIERVERSGISATKVDVLEGAALADENVTSPGHRATDLESVHQQTHTHQHHPQTQHEHKTGRSHTHDHDHSPSQEQERPHEHQHGRSLSVIRELI